MKLRSHILIITTTILLPLLAFVCIVLVLHFQSGRETQLQNLVATSRALSLALDKDFEARVAALKTLAQSVHLRDGDLNLFDEESKRVLPVHEGADAIVLVTPRVSRSPIPAGLRRLLTPIQRPGFHKSR
jgi:hypothetical protein